MTKLLIEESVVRQALEALEMCAHEHNSVIHSRMAFTALRAALNQPKVEPVAWMHPSRDPHLLSHSAYTYGSASIPLYTHPAPSVEKEQS